jgi:putative ABC transport system permease protein
VGLDGILALSPLTRPGGGEIAIDGWVLGATVLGALTTGLLFGLAPVASVWKTDVQAALKDGRGRASGAGGRLRSSLVVAEIALALVLVSGAGLMVQSVQRMLDVDVGMETENALVAQFSLPAGSYPGPQEQILFYDRLLEQAGSLPGVEAAALATLVPPASGGQYHVRVEGVHEAWTMDLPVARTRAVSANYFDAMGIPLLRGRTFTEDDDGAAPMVVMVDQAFVDQHFPDEDPIGRQIRTLLDQPREIVGVVGNVANAGLQNQAGPTTYFPYAQQPFGNGQTIVLRTASDPATFVPALQEAVWSLDADLPLVGVQTLEERLAASVQQSRFNSLLLSLFGVLAALLAGIGIYGVVAYTVSERTAELGLRMALGASGGSVRGLVLGKALRLTLAGVGVGLVASLSMTRVIEGFLFGVEPTDPRTLVAVSGALCLVAIVASLVPAMRASRLDPLHALREESS